MTNKQKRVVVYNKEKARLFQQLKEYIESEEFYQYNPILQRAIELGRDEHLPLDQAIKIAKQEFSQA